MKQLVLWAALAVVALGAIGVLAVAVKKQTKPSAPPEQPRPDASISPRVDCTVPAAVTVRALPDAEDPPVILWAVGAVRIFLDDAPAFSSPEDPKHFKLGQHTLRVEAEGAERLKTQVRFDAFTPAFFHAEEDPDVGLTLVRAGAACSSCNALDNRFSLAYEPARVRPEVLLSQGAEALRRDDWQTAAAFLKGVPSGARQSPVFHRMVAALYTDALQPDAARAEMLAIPARESHDLRAVLQQFDALKKREEERRAQVVRARWNKVTERFQGVIDRFNTQAPGPTASASRRLAELSSAFDEASKEGDVFEQEKVFAAAEEALLSVVIQVRAARPKDCEFQSAVVGTAMR